MKTTSDARDAMLAHHRELRHGVDARVATLVEAANANRPIEAAVANLVADLAEEVIPHALAEEATIYARAAQLPALAGLVTSMIAEHRTLVAATETLARTTAPADASARATALAALFAGHVDRENDVLLPGLIEAGVDLADVLSDMQGQLQALSSPHTAASTAGDPQAAVLNLLFDAATDLARVGMGERACQLVASAWASLHATRPDLAAVATARMHRLVRSVSHDEVALSPRPTALAELDVRSLAPTQRHEAIFAAFFGLAPGEGYVLVNDHDPKPLYYQFEAEHAGEFTWRAIESGPSVWRVAIAKTVARDAVELDVRPLAHGRRHDVIFTAFEGLRSGGSFVLVNDHDPRPLRFQFDARHAGAYSWDYLEAGPSTWRVRIARTA
ncbi:MAG: DUF2249 domain-containing protein [Acidobacteriota bacterium]|nr:DUF2249 domain-containing protein [Acidobacteriota bacterium]